MGLEKSNSKTFASIVNERPFIRIRTDESNSEAIKREYETSDGKKGIKYELGFDRLTGKITNIQIVSGDYGKQLQITIDGVVLSISLSTGFADDILKKLPGVDFEKEASLVPYSFEDEKKRPRKGITVYQGEEKLGNYFYDGENNLHGFPELPENYKEFDSEDWKVYFIGVSKFLQKYLEKNVVPKVHEAQEGINISSDEQTPLPSDEDEIDINSIPF